MWLKKSVHFEQHYLSKWKIIQPRALQWNLSLFLQLLKTIPEVNSSLCSHILIFCRAEKLSWPYFSTCKTNFLWLKSEFTAGSCSALHARSTGKLPNLPAAMREWGKENELIWDEDQSLYKFSGVPHGLFHQQVWMCKGGLESLRHLWWLRAGCQADHVSCVLASNTTQEWKPGICTQIVKVSLSGCLPLLAVFPAVPSCLLIPALQRVIRAASLPSAPLPASPPSPLWHATFPDPSPHSLLCLPSPTSRCHSSESGLTRPLQKDYFSFFNH